MTNGPDWDAAIARSMDSELAALDQTISDELAALDAPQGPSNEWSQALALVDRAYRVLADAVCPDHALVAFADVYAAVIAHHLSHDHNEPEGH